MDNRGRLHRLALAFPLKVPRGQAPQFLVNGRKKVVSGIAVAIPPASW
jgi:hypothetical protein